MKNAKLNISTEAEEGTKINEERMRAADGRMVRILGDTYKITANFAGATAASVKGNTVVNLKTGRGDLRNRIVFAVNNRFNFVS